MSNKINQIFNKPKTTIDTDIYLSGSITSPEDYIEILQTLRDATAGESIKIILNTGGGQVSTAVQIIAGIRNCAGKVTCVIEGECHSAGTFIFLAADEWIVNHNSLMLIHNYSGGAYGKGADLVQNVLAQDKWLKQLVRETYEGFLEPEEIESVIDGKDTWLGTEEITERLVKVVALREAQMEEYEEAQRQELLKNLKEINDERQDSERVSEGTEEQ